MNKLIGEAKLISNNVLENNVYYSIFNLLYNLILNENQRAN